MQHASAMKEPYRTRFIESIKHGAASRDMHDSLGLGEFDATLSNGAISDGFLQRELTRVDIHAKNLCEPLVAKLQSAERILDMGCGTGGASVALALSALNPSEVVGVDAAADAIVAARIRAQSHSLSEPRIRFEHVAAGNRLPYADGSFDLVVCVSVLEFIAHHEERSRFVAELIRVTRREGHVFLATPNPFRLREQHSRRLLGDLRRRPGYPWSNRPAELICMFKGCDVTSLAKDRIRNHPTFGKPLGWAAPALAWALPWQRILARKIV